MTRSLCDENAADCHLDWGRYDLNCKKQHSSCLCRESGLHWCFLMFGESLWSRIQLVNLFVLVCALVTSFSAIFVLSLPFSTKVQRQRILTSSDTWDECYCEVLAETVSSNEKSRILFPILVDFGQWTSLVVAFPKLTGWSKSHTAVSKPDKSFSILFCTWHFALFRYVCRSILIWMGLAAYFADLRSHGWSWTDRDPSSEKSLHGKDEMILSHTDIDLWYRHLSQDFFLHLFASIQDL